MKGSEQEAELDGTGETEKADEAESTPEEKQN